MLETEEIKQYSMSLNLDFDLKIGYRELQWNVYFEVRFFSKSSKLKSHPRHHKVTIK